MDTFTAVTRSTQPSTLRGTVNEYQYSGWVMLNGDGGCRREQPTGRLTAQVGSLGLTVVSHLALLYTVHSLDELSQ